MTTYHQKLQPNRRR